MGKYKLMEVSIGDLSSSIFFEDNYGLSEFDEVNKLKHDLEDKGYTCLLAKMGMAIMVS